MTPPDTNLKKQKRRHRFPLVGMAIIAVFAIGVIIYWILEEVATAPGPQDESEAATPADDPEGEGNAPPSDPAEPVEPDDPDVETQP
ncbi:hypothetical protein [Maritimibacter sp. HL-12]|jgi:hypothetical protein|uniref:hypothetical protein n=1 Tax=Maritimibacter sp. HL-12 TaxID=1162418 RepID=UPI000A0F0222|nr:hypothetical protein [Maritimibacter sp. HL-12]SMH57518.1 hypothetical protein SAMN05661107_3429 [Maritimibacter sp. HL-12]